MAACVIYYRGPCVMELKDKNATLSSYSHTTIHGRLEENLQFLECFALIQNFLMTGETFLAFLQGYSIGHKCHNIRSLIRKKGFVEDNTHVPDNARGLTGVHMKFKKHLDHIKFHYY